MATISNINFTDELDCEGINSASWSRRRDQPLQGDQNIHVEVRSDQIFQTWEGFGGAVSELGMQAVQTLSKEKQNEFFEAVFGKSGLGLAWIRLPLGSSDFALDAYSYAQTPEDYELKHFSIDRDKELIIPFIRAAKEVNPQLRIHASPWSPPGWMKKSGTMDDLRRLGIEEGRLRCEPKVLSAYAKYLRMVVQAYEAEGLPISRLMVQNEMDSVSKFPTCAWDPELFVDFHLNYLKPELEAHHCETEIWAGTFRTISGMQAHDCFSDEEFRSYVSGCAFQYSFPETMRDLALLYPRTRFMHTESVCHGGENSEFEAVYQFDNVLECMQANIDVFTYWNIVLSQTPRSSWGWKQNSLVTVNTEDGVLSYNPDFRVYRFLYDHIKPGAVRLMSFSYQSTTLAVRNPDGTHIVLLRNLDEERTATIKIDGKTQSVELPGYSICAIELEKESCL